MLLPYQPTYHDGADGYFDDYDDKDKYGSVWGNEKERDRVTEKEKDKIKEEKGRDRDRVLERRPTMGESVMAAVGRMGRVLGGERR